MQAHDKRCFNTRAFTWSLQGIEISARRVYLCVISLQLPLSTIAYKYLDSTANSVFKVRHAWSISCGHTHLESFCGSGSNIRIFNKR